MASQLQVSLTGRLANVVFYKMNDKYYCRTIPKNIKQTDATKQRASEFGKAASIGKALRQQLMPVIPLPRDNRMQVRFLSAICKWLRSNKNLPTAADNVLDDVSRFQFTNGYSVRERWNFNYEITYPVPGFIQLKIPAFVPSQSISAPANTVYVKCRITAAGCMVHDAVATGSFSTILYFDYNNIEVPEQIIALPVPTSTGTIVVTAISLEYYFKKSGMLQKINNEKFMPAGIVAARYFV